MHNYLLKVINLLIILLLPIATLAEDCASGDASCEVTKRQTDSFKKADIQPLQPIPLSLKGNVKDAPQKVAPTAATVSAPLTTNTVQPFEIPTPGASDIKDNKDNFNDSASPINQKNDGGNIINKTKDSSESVQPINIYK
jgi:hypothetical protein